MAIFSLKPSREATLHRTYTEAYEASLQSIVKESSFDEAGALTAWKETLAHITTGMAQLDGAPPKNAQEMSLLTSIMDIERQCHDKIPKLEGQIQQKSRLSLAINGYTIPASPNHVPAFSPNVSSLSLNEKKRPSRVAVGSKAPATSGSSPAAPGSSPAASQQSIHPIVMPKVGDMPYQMYSQKPTIPIPPAQSSSTPISKTVAPAPAQSAEPAPAPVAPPHNPLKARKEAKKAAKELKKKEEVKKDPQRSSLDYPQPQPAPSAHGHSMLSTLRSKTPWRRKPTPANSLTRLTPSQEDLSSPALQAAQQTTANHTANHAPAHSGPLSPQTHAPTAESKDTAMFHGFDSVCAVTDPTSPTTNPLGSPISSPQLGSSSQFSQSPKQSHSSPSMPSAAFSPPAAASPAAAAPTAHAASSSVSRSSPASHSTSAHHSKPSHHHPSSAPSRSVSPPAVKQHVQQRASYKVAYDKVSTSTGRTILRPRVVRSPVVSQKSSPRSSASVADAHSAQKFSSSSSNSTSRSSPKHSPKPSPEPESEDVEMDEWDRMAHAKIKDLRGVDKGAAKQIISEIVLKGDKVAWDDIAGLDRAKASLKETVVYPFLRPDLFMGLREPVLGMLLFGPPGTGKTMLARAVAAESKSTFFSISASSLTSKYMGESEKLVRALFQIAKALAPSIIFVDEIDSILTQRADQGEHEASRRIKNEFLVQWSDLQSAAAGKNTEDSEVRRVLVLGATNLPWAIDEAARRRFVRRQYIPLPEPYTRRVHLEKLLSHQKHAVSSAELDRLVELTDGYSGSDLTALAKDAAMGPLRSLGDALLTTAPDQIRSMGMSDFVESMKSIRPSVSPEGLQAFEQWASMYGSSGA